MSVIRARPTGRVLRSIYPPRRLRRLPSPGVVLTAAGLVVLAACTSGTPPAEPTPQPGTPAPAGPTTEPVVRGPVITGFHTISEITCTGAQAAVPAAWATRGAQTVSFEVDGQPLSAAAGYATSGTGNIPVPCDGREHQILLVATNAGQQASKSEHVNTQNAPPPPEAPKVTSFQVLGDVSCPGGSPIPVAAAWVTQNATTVSFSVDGEPLSAAAGYPTTGTGNIPVQCDGRAHKVTITAGGASPGSQSSLSRSVDTEPFAPVVPETPTATPSPPATLTPPPSPPATLTPPPTPTPTG
jgi:hypothetical protein